MDRSPIAYRDIWNRKPVLREVYADIYRRLLEACAPGSILEIGGGSGNFKAFKPQTMSSDIARAPWLDIVCDAQQLPFASERVFKQDGRLIYCEPAITPLSGIFYRLFHDEPVDFLPN